MSMMKMYLPVSMTVYLVVQVAVPRLKDKL